MNHTPIAKERTTPQLDPDGFQRALKTIKIRANNTRGVQCRISDIGSDPKIRISENFDPKFSDRVTGFSDRITGFRIGSVEFFEKSRSVSDPKTRNFFRIPDPKYPRSLNRIGYPKFRIGSADFRIEYFGSDIFAHP